MIQDDIRPARSRWPRLMKEPDACEYLSIGRSTLRDHGPPPKRHGRAVLYDIRDLDRWADRLSDLPLEPEEHLKEAESVEDAFFRNRNRRDPDGPAVHVSRKGKVLAVSSERPRLLD